MWFTRSELPYEEKGERWHTRSLLPYEDCRTKKMVSIERRSKHRKKGEGEKEKSHRATM